ncbi:MAG: response regulator, partial [Eubacterium sp.]|nr:response regulator [Eubacterium sp.]
LCAVNYDIFYREKKAFDPDLIVMCFVNYTQPDRRFMNLLTDSARKIPMVTVGLELVDKIYGKVEAISNFQNIKRWDGGKNILQVSCQMLGLSVELIGSGDFFAQRGRNKPKILVVDDIAMLLRQIHMLLKEKYDVEVANSGMAAMAAIGRGKPDLILLDYNMPVDDGKRIFEALKASDATKDIPVVFLTGVSDYERVEEIIALRPAGYLLKPPDKDKLVEMIDMVLERQRQRIVK